MAEAIEENKFEMPRTENNTFQIDEIIYTFAEFLPRDTRGLTVQLHLIARDHMPIKLDVVGDMLSHGLDQLSQDKSLLATNLESVLNEADITLTPRLKDLILTRSTKMDEEGKLLLAEHADLLDKITQEISPAAVLRAQVQSDSELIVNQSDREIRPEYRKLYGQLDQVLTGSIDMVCYSHYLQELMRQGLREGKLTQAHIELAHKLNADYLKDRGFVSRASSYLHKQGVRVTVPMIEEWASLANVRNSLTNPLQA